MQSCKGGRVGEVEAGGGGGKQGWAPQLSNHPGPAGSCNSCPSHLFPPCQLPPPLASLPGSGGGLHSWGLPREGGAGLQGAWRPGMTVEDFLGDPEEGHRLWTSLAQRK